MKKNRLLVFLLLLLLISLSACNNKIEEELLAADKGLFVYESCGSVDAIAVDEEGMLYTATFLQQKKAGEGEEGIPVSDYVYQPDIQQISIFDLEGNLVSQKELEMSNGTINTMFIEDGALYCVATKSNLENYGPMLYKVDLSSWEIEELFWFVTYRSIDRVVTFGEYFYAIGRLKNPTTKSYLLHPDVIAYSYGGEAICRVNIIAETPQVETMQIDFPIDIVETGNDTLVIYYYDEENGFGFLEFSPREGSITERGWKQSQVKDLYFTRCGNGYLFFKESGLYYGTLDGTEAQLTAEKILLWNPAIYQKGFAFYQNGNEENRIERICVADIIKDNKEIHLLMHQDIQDEPYGCGYQMEKQVLDSEQYALKVLARDPDFDLFLLSSRDNTSYNIRENGVFYALNEVKGVQEYLDACFPYIKELATNEDGDIWMIPVKLAITGMIYNKEYCKKMGVDFSSMDLAQFFLFTEQCVLEEQTMSQEEVEQSIAKVSLSTYIAREELLGQYLSAYDSFDTQVYRDYVSLVRDICEESGGWMLAVSRSGGSALKKGQIVDFYYDCFVYQNDLKQYIAEVGNSDVIGAMGLPKLAEGVNNIGTLTFLAVNPQSENLEDTLAYITTFCEYMMEMKDSYMLADECTYTDTSLNRDLYQLYANGEVRFDMDASVHEELFWNFINGDIELEDMIAEAERKRKIYIGE